MPPKKPVTRGSWLSVALSILLHAAIVAAAVYGWFTWKHKPPEPETMAIEGTVVDERAMRSISPPPQPAPTPPTEQEPPPPEPTPPEEQGPPKPDPEEVQRRQEEERLAQEKAEQERQQQLEREKEAQEQKLREEAERAEQQKIEEQKQAAARAAAEKAAAEKAAAEKRAAEKKRAEEAAAARRAAEEKARKAQEEELRRSLEAEERINAARNSEAAASWRSAIAARIERAWIRPTQAEGVTCIVSVSQVPGGEITSVRVDSCSPDNAALRDSVEAAVYRASPLPPPPEGVPFERNLRLRFAPQ
jgi:colicin import membrane protein